MVGEIAEMYRDDMVQRRAKPDISELWVLCRVCRRWSDGQSDLCPHCLERLVGSRPLSDDSVAGWVEGQVYERALLGIPVPIEDVDLLCRWASFHSVNPIADTEADEAAVPGRGSSPEGAWQTAEPELSAAKSLPGSTPRQKRSRWLWLSAIGAVIAFGAFLGVIVLVLVVEAALGPTGEAPGPLRILMWVFLIGSWAGIVLVPVGVIGWLLAPLATADNWRDRFSPLAQTGALVTLGALALAGFAAFSTQDGTDIESKEALFFFFLRIAAAGFVATLVASLGYAAVRIYHHRRPAQSSNPSATNRRKSTSLRP